MNKIDGLRSVRLDIRHLTETNSSHKYWNDFAESQILSQQRHSQQFLMNSASYSRLKTEDADLNLC